MERGFWQCRCVDVVKGTITKWRGSIECWHELKSTCCLSFIECLLKWEKSESSADWCLRGSVCALFVTKRNSCCPLWPDCGLQCQEGELQATGAKRQCGIVASECHAWAGWDQLQGSNLQEAMKLPGEGLDELLFLNLGYLMSCCDAKMDPSLSFLAWDAAGKSECNAACLGLDRCLSSKRDRGHIALPWAPGNLKAGSIFQLCE